MTKITRRNFLKGLALLGTSITLAELNVLATDIPSRSSQRDRPYDHWRIPDSEWMMVIDLSKCDGCVDQDVPRCTKACITGHYTPDDHEYIKVFEVVENEFVDKTYFPRPCQQCRDPPCARICPVSAAWQRDGDRLTLVDHSRCIGCRLCMAACPYDVRFFFFEENPKADEIPDDQYENQMPFALFKGKGVTTKCEFCGLQFIGELPHCVTACPRGALYFGNINEDAVTNSEGKTEPLTELIKHRGGYRWREEEGTRPRVIYLPSENGG